MKHWGLVLALIGGGCGQARPPATPEERGATATATATAQARRTWRAGVGVDGCRLGDAVAECERALGPATRDGDYATFRAAGVEAHVEHERIGVVFVKYMAKEASAFDGADEHGIGAEATVQDVLATFGMPSRVGDSIVSEYGEFPGAHDHTVEFDDRGLSFTFLDGRLEHVVIGAPHR